MYYRYTKKIEEKLRMKHLLVFITLLCAFVSSFAQNDWLSVISPDNTTSLNYVKGTEAQFTTGVVGWGPNWGWRSVSSSEKALDTTLDLNYVLDVDKSKGQLIKINQKTFRSDESTITSDYQLSSLIDVPLTQLVVTINTLGNFKKGKAFFYDKDNKKTEKALDFGYRGTQGLVSKIEMVPEKGDMVTVTFSPAVNITFDGQVRIELAAVNYPAGEKKVQMNVTVQNKVKFIASDKDFAEYVKVVPGADWFAYQPKYDMGASEIGMEEWLEKPAGIHGQARLIDGKDYFQFEDGTKIKFWGTNLSYGASAPSKENADFTAQRFAKYGINAVRMHKFLGPNGWEGIADPNDATLFDTAGIDRLDYFTKKLTDTGVYYSFSHTFRFKIAKGNKDKLIAYDEIIKSRPDGNTYAFINFATDVQDLMIERVVNLLKHKNSYTEKTYAEDKALIYIELQNEDDIFFWTSGGVLDKTPTYKKLFLARYADFLTKKYETTEKLKTAWGGLPADQTLEAKNISIETNPWFMSGDFLRGQPEAARVKYLDAAAFLHQEQNNFYSKFVKAIQNAGYKGPVCGSPWQAPAMLPHYYNLKSDALAGFVDRHNYFGSSIDHTMMSNPGSGFFSTGLQQVKNRPFGLSEWIHEYPAIYSAEGPAIIAAYGLGLQGWDASFEFQSESGKSGFDTIVGKFPWGKWNVDAPTQIGQFPTLARMIYRGDIKESDIISIRKVSDENLATGKFDFDDNVIQSGDIKTFTGTVPAKSLAMGRVVVDFTKENEKSTFPDLKLYEKDKVITSSTNQLKWNYEGKGFFTIDTAGTKGVVGFSEGTVNKLGNIQISPLSGYASIIVTSSDKKKDLANCAKALITAVARNANKGMKVFIVNNNVIDNGTGPILLEPVKARFKVADRTIAQVIVLDLDGKLTDKTIEVKDGEFTIDTAKDKTIFYQIIFK